MDTENLQDVLRCQNCETPLPRLYCLLCHILLCKTCVGEHLLDESKTHHAVPIKQKWYPEYPECPTHSPRQCELFCEECNVPICVMCISTVEHRQHNICILENKMAILESELKEFKDNIYPAYQLALKDFECCKTNLRENSVELEESIKEHGEFLHKEIDNIIANMQYEHHETASKQQALLDKEENEIRLRTEEISQIIFDLNNLVSTRDDSLFPKYESKLKEFRKLPPRFNVFLPTFSPQPITTEKLSEVFGSLSRDEHSFMRNFLAPVSSPSPDLGLINRTPGKTSFLQAKKKHKKEKS